VPQVSPLRPGYDAHLTNTVPGDPPQGEFHLLDLHLDRLQSSATYFNFVFDRDEVLARLQALAASLPPQPHRIRLLLHANGELTLEHAHFTPDARPISVRLSPHRTSSGDVFLRHKTTHRALYDEQLTAARAAGFDEVLFLNERGELTEGAISNLFIERAGKLFTPPLTSGVLPGIFRRHLLQSDPSAAEKVLTLADLQTAEAIYLCSSLRGLREVDRLILHS
jgi:para-aminobenzoate synthetase/4-amino-4-deoxychorismate lyase